MFNKLNLIVLFVGLTFATYVCGQSVSPQIGGGISQFDGGISSTLVPSWVPNRANLPDIAFNFTTNSSWIKATKAQNTASSLLTVSRASSGTVNDSLGNWTSVASNLPRLSDLGLLVEEARTNSIRNNSMAGAVVGVIGSGGALPTNWSSAVSGAGATATFSVIGTGTENGIDYIDVRIQATAAAVAAVTSINFETSTGSAALYGQTWTNSAFLTLSGGAATNGSAWILGADETTSGGAFVASNSLFPGAPTAVALSSARKTNSFTTDGVTTAAIRSYYRFQTAIGTSSDITLRIGWPQLENNNINSTVASAATAASGASGVNGSAVYSVGGGTGTAATLNVTWAAGVMTVNSVASAGNYSVFPPSPAALTYVSGTATGWTGATVNLTPTNNAALAFATSPIVTSASAATRAADNVTTPSQTFGSAYTLFAQGTPAAPLNYAQQTALSISDGTSSNRVNIRRANTNQGQLLVQSGGGAVSNALTAGLWAQSTLGKLAASFATGFQAISLNGGAVGTAAAAALPITPTVIQFGGDAANGFPFNGFVSQAAIWASQRVPNAQLQSMTQ